MKIILKSKKDALTIEHLFKGSEYIIESEQDVDLDAHVIVFRPRSPLVSEDHKTKIENVLRYIGIEDFVIF